VFVVLLGISLSLLLTRVPPTIPLEHKNDHANRIGQRIGRIGKALEDLA
jgi:hypothetical protein